MKHIADLLNEIEASRPASILEHEWAKLKTDMESIMKTLAERLSAAADILEKDVPVEMAGNASAVLLKTENDSLSKQLADEVAKNVDLEKEVARLEAVAAKLPSGVAAAAATPTA